ncbi:MAG TPA: DNA polymerase III subunit delta' [Anaerolineae bacterium]|nr:DNA polymerase III subunit delta' [Anaerolineae bacterium]
MNSRWQSLIGHDWAVQLLTAAITHGRIGHAYLFTGPAHIGKITLARLFTQALNCLDHNPQQRPCGICRPCQLIANDRHSDVHILTPELSSRGIPSIKINAIRELQRDLQLTAAEGRYKIAIIRQFDAANINAANAFLKTLEEPPNNVILLLTATDADALLDTIRSRCRTIQLRPLATADIETALQTRWQLPPAEAQTLAHIANGRLGWALRAHHDPTLQATRQTHLDHLDTTLQGDHIIRFNLADKLAKKAADLPPLLQTWVSWWHDLILLQTGRPLGHLTNIDRQTTLNQYAQTLTPAQTLTSLQQTQETILHLDRNVNTRLALENLFLTYPFPAH